MSRRPGRRLRVLLTGDGLAWSREERLGALAAGDGVDVALCSRSARDRGEDPDLLPAWIRWSSLVQWLLGRASGDRLWTCLP